MNSSSDTISSYCAGLNILLQISYMLSSPQGRSRLRSGADAAGVLADDVLVDMVVAGCYGAFL